jgi:polar amino acid transport system substrate-binding protein
MLGIAYRQGWWRLGLVVIALTVVSISLCALEEARSQETTASPPLRVGVYVSPPFVTRIGENSYSGMAIDLWTEVARRIGVTFDYREYDTVRDVLRDTAAGTLDAAVTNVTITRDRAEAAAFTQPWYDGGLRIMVHTEGSGGFWGIFTGLESAGHLRAYAWLILVILVATVGLTLFDRKFDSEFPKRWREGLAESLHHVMSIATSGRASRKNLFGWLGRIWQSVWLVVGVAVIAYITSSVTSVMTAVSLTGDIHSLSDLPGRTTAVFTGTVAEDYARELGLPTRSYPNIDASVEALEAGEVDAIVADAPILEHYAHTNADRRVDVVGNIFHPDKYGFAFPHDSELVHAVTLEILALQETGVLQDMKQRYFGTQ